MKAGHGDNTCSSFIQKTEAEGSTEVRSLGPTLGNIARPFLKVNNEVLVLRKIWW
jgi:hypothetical protein